eukprot:g12397.t1
MPNDQTYQSPLASRNASPEMQAVWSPRFKFTTWRKLWLALAESEQQLGLSITDEQLDEMRGHLEDIDYDTAADYEKKLRHDVMAHVHTFGEAAPKAMPIIHLGATSQFVVCNSELIMLREALTLVANKLATVIDRLGKFANQYRDMPALGFTHYQPAQPTTVGKRATLWAQELAMALEEIEHRLSTLKFRGVKGTTGTQASFLALFDGDHDKVDRLDELVTEKMGWDKDKRFAVTGQTYPRLLDAMVGSSLGTVAAALMKMATDIRLLSNRMEMDEPFEKKQIGSSAMPYKRNPMRCERMCGLSRFVISLVQAPYTTASEQWMERTLDDSSCRRLTLPEPFLALDGVLDIAINVTSGLVVYDKMVETNLAKYLPFMATENIMMAAVQQGGDRQELHEVIRKHAIEVATNVKEHGADNDLLERLGNEPGFAGIDLSVVLDAKQYVGRSPEQVDAFIADIVEPIRQRYAEAEATSDETLPEGTAPSEAERTEVETTVPDVNDPGLIPEVDPDIPTSPTVPDAKDLSGNPIDDAERKSIPGLSYILPEGWTVGPPKTMRLLTLLPPDGEGSDLAISRWPGDVGGFASNVQRWVRQAGLPPIPGLMTAAASDFEKFNVDGTQATWIPLMNDDTNRAILAVWVPIGENPENPDETWTFKLTCTADQVQAFAPAVRAFCESIKFE